jgi:hypothetical protein
MIIGSPEAEPRDTGRSPGGEATRVRGRFLDLETGGPG